MEQLGCFDDSLPQYILTVFLFLCDDSLHGFKGLIFGYLDCHIIVIIIGILIDLIINNNLILFIPEMQEDAVLVPALRLAREILAVLDCTEEYLHSVVDLVEGLRVG